MHKLGMIAIVAAQKEKVIANFSHSGKVHVSTAKVQGQCAEKDCINY